MVRGNWQRRVEKTEARRQETKQRKQRTEDKKAFKGWVRTFLNQLDVHQEVIRKRKCTIYIWTDALPSSGPPLLDLLEEQHHGKGAKKGAATKRQEGVRNRSASIESEGSAKQVRKGSPSKRGGGRNRSASIESEGSTTGGESRGKPTSNTPSKRKVHPRSKEAFEFMDKKSVAVENESLPMLCRQHFLYGKCENRSGKKGICPHVHYDSSKYKSLSSVLTPKGMKSKTGLGNNNSSKEVIQKVEAALVMANDPTISNNSGSTPDIASFSETNSGSTMDMLYYSAMVTQLSVDDTTSNLSEDIAAEFARTETPLATMVYVAIDDVLVFDRNQEGMLADAMDAYMSDIISSFRKSSISGEHDGQDTSGTLGEKANYANLPGAVLEHMLTFLPDAAVAYCSQVCRSWNHEIGQHSPNLWTYLLQRNGWPSIQDTVIADHRLQDSSQDEGHQLLRRLFVDHHVAMRDVNALASAIPPILSQAAHAGIEEKEVTFQAFNARKHSPNRFDDCVGVEEWSANHVLAGYSKECTLRLYQAVPFRGNHKRCKELVCQSVDPYRATKKRSCTLGAIAVDEDMIGCLCNVTSTQLDSDIGAPILVVVRRDDFLMVESSAVAAKGGGNGIYSMTDELQVIDIGEAVLNYILSCDTVDHRLLPLFDFLNEGGEVGDVFCRTMRSSCTPEDQLAACGYGRFMVEISICLPSDEDDLDYDFSYGSRVFTQLDRKLVLLSASAGAIVWMGDSCPSSGTLPDPYSLVIVSSLRRPRLQGGSRNSCSLAVGAVGSNTILTLAIDSSGRVDVPTTVPDSENARSSFASAYADYTMHPSETLIMTPTVLVTHNAVSHSLENDEIDDIKSMIFFFHRYPDLQCSAVSTLTLSGALEINDMVSLRDSYLVLICTEFIPESSDTDSDEENEDAEGGEPAELTYQREWLIVVHIASCREIGRVSLPASTEYNYFPRFIATPSGGTIAMALGGFGIAMTGEDVRGLKAAEGDATYPNNTNNNSKAGKKKKPARSKKGGSKKDGFARGMSLRG